MSRPLDKLPMPERALKEAESNATAAREAKELRQRKMILAGRVVNLIWLALCTAAMAVTVWAWWGIFR
jgi:hypothetical protein